MSDKEDGERGREDKRRKERYGERERVPKRLIDMECESMYV